MSDEAAERNMGDTAPLAAVPAGSVSIAMWLRKEILNGRYAYGERLPAERELASRFGIARGTVREALRRLEELDMVTRRAGSGTFVSYRERTESDEIAEATSPVELIEVRFAVEPHIVRLAVLNASARELEDWGRALKRVEAVDGDPEAFSRADEEFHLALAQCSRNPLLLWLYQQINDVRGHAQWSASRDKILTPERITGYNRQHRALYEAVASRDMEVAITTITDHLTRARAHLLGEAID